MYLMAGATQSVVEDVMKRIRGIYRRNGFIIKDNEMLSGLNDFCRCIKQADFHFFNRIDNHVINCTWGMGRDENHPDAPGNAEAYDGFSQDQLEVGEAVDAICGQDGKEQRRVRKSVRHAEEDAGKRALQGRGHRKVQDEEN